MMTVEKSELIAVRDYQDSDKNFIFASWLRGLYYGDSWYSQVPKKIFMDHYHPFVEALLAAPSTKISIACLKEDPDVILGYAVLNKDETKLHWVFVKSSWRSIGIARSLVPKSIKTVTNLTKVGLSIIKNRNGVEFNPFAMI